MTLRLEADNPYEDADDDDTERKFDPAVAQQILELDQKLKTIYSSMDNNNGILEENYLIPYVLFKRKNVIFLNLFVIYYCSLLVY